MIAEPIVVVGAGGFGRNVLDAIEAVNRAADRPTLNVLGVLDDSPGHENLARLERRGVPHLGPIEGWLAEARDVRYVSGLGIPAVRLHVAERFAERGLPSVTVVHPGAVVSPHVSVDQGTVILGGVQVLADAIIGKHVHLNANAMIGHDSVIDDFVSVNPGGAVSGRCHVQRGVMVGAGAVILQGLTVGAGSIVGAAACVVHDVSPGVTVVGVPAR
ncbi:NeuD/PglB/VioB family sugar acetyltransferase [Blastococcus sp. SYSU D00922]